MMLMLADMNARVGFWRAWKPLQDSGYPRAFLWLCGCHGVSYDGQMVGVVTCKGHQFRLDDLVISPLDSQDYYIIDRMCKDAFRHLLWGSLDNGDARKSAIAAIMAARGDNERQGDTGRDH